MGARERRKGAVGERKLVARLKSVFPEARRRCSGEESQRDHGRDLDGTKPFVVQSCFAHAPPIYLKLAEAEAASKQGEVPVAMTKRTRGSWLVTMRLDDWLVMAKPFMAQVIERAKHLD